MKCERSYKYQGNMAPGRDKPSMIMCIHQWYPVQLISIVQTYRVADFAVDDQTNCHKPKPGIKED